MRVRNLNAGAYNADGTVNINNFTAIGPFYVYQEPVGLRDIASKNYVDQQTTTFNTAYITTGTLSRDRLPAFTGQLSKSAGNAPVQINVGNTAAAGTYASVTVGAHGFVTAAGPLSSVDVPSFAWSKITSGKPTTVAGWGITDALLKSGGTVSGPVSITGGSIDYSNVLHGVTKSYVDTAIAGMAAGTVSYKTGEFRLLPNSTTPSGYLRCNGAAVSKTTYAALYAVVGDVYAEVSMPGAGRPWATQSFNTSASTISGWSNSAATLPATIWYGSSVVVTKNRIYLLGGENNGGVTSSTLTAAINADGSLGAWSAGTALPVALSRASSVITKNRVYLIGGLISSGNASNAVYKATINSDGTLTAFVSTTAMPSACMMTHVVYTGDRVYILGGSSTSTSTSVTFYITIDVNGDLSGSWQNGASLADAIHSAGLCVTSNYVYLLGGYKTNVGTMASVQRGTLSNGQITSWVTDSLVLPTGIYAATCVATKGRVHLIGGNTAAGDINAVSYTAAINANGTLGSWTTESAIAVPVGSGHVAITKDKINVIGGLQAGGTLYTIPQVAAISGGLNDYSPYYDGTVTATASTDFKLPDITANETIGLYTYIKT